MEPCRQASAMASCAVRLEHSVELHDLLAQLVIARLLAEAGQSLGHMLLVPPSCARRRAWEGASPAAEKHNVCGSSWSRRGCGGAA